MLSPGFRPAHSVVCPLDFLPIAGGIPSSPVYPLCRRLSRFATVSVVLHGSGVDFLVQAGGTVFPQQSSVVVVGGPLRGAVPSTHPALNV